MGKGVAMLGGVAVSGCTGNNAEEGMRRVIYRNENILYSCSYIYGL